MKCTKWFSSSTKNFPLQTSLDTSPENFLSNVQLINPVTPANSFESDIMGITPAPTDNQ